jgi:type IV fimbrial biogenesis protein FimT
MRKTQTGFTIIELMVTLALAAIVLMAAVPSFNQIIKSNRLTANVNDLVYAVSLARSEALKSGGASVCASSDGATCDDVLWKQGWIVFTDFDGDCAVDGGEQVVKVFDAIADVNDIQSVDGIKCVAYGSNGYLTAGNGNLAAVAGIKRDFLFCDDRTDANAGRQININTAGRPTTATYNGCPVTSN